MAQNPSICKSHGWSLGETNLFSTYNSCIYVKDESLDNESLLTLMTELKES